jgi:hypothetical protein
MTNGNAAAPAPQSEPDSAQVDAAAGDQQAQINALKLEKQLAELNKETLAAKKAAVDAQKELAASELALKTAGLPKAEVALPTGAVTSESASYMAELIAYGAMQRTAEAIAARINALPDSKLSPAGKILIVNNMAVAEGEYPRLLVEAQFNSFEKQLGALLRRMSAHLPEGVSIAEFAGPAAGEPGMTFEAALAPAAIAALGIAPQLLGAAAAVLGYFRTDYDVKNKDVALADSALKAAVAGKISKGDVHISNFSLVAKSRLLDRYVSLLEKRYALGAGRTVLEESVLTALEAQIEAIDAQLAALKEEADGRKRKELETKKAALLQQKAEVERITADAQVLITHFDAFADSLAASAGGQPSLIALATLSDRLLEEGITHLLFLKVESKGGEGITKKTLWTKGGERAFLGGIAASYVLAKVDGEIVSADTITAASELHRRIGSGGPAKVLDIEMPDARE